MLSDLFNSLLSLTFPQQCHVCRGSVDDLAYGIACAACWQSTRFFDGSESLCGKCGAFLSADGGSVVSFCRQCPEQAFDRAIAVGIYEHALSASIRNLKREQLLPRFLHRKIADTIERNGLASSTAILPIPLSRRRRFERQFNQAEVIAELISRETNIRVDTHSLRRKRHTPLHRVGMDNRARELTVAGAFEVVAPRLIQDQRVLLVDDVFTSGSTASACAKVLKKNGASEVNVFTLARAVLDRLN